MDGTFWFGVMMICIVIWMVYMMTFRTEDFLKICKADEERKARQRQTFGKVFKTGMGIGKFVGRRKGWW